MDCEGVSQPFYAKVLYACPCLYLDGLSSHSVTSSPFHTATIHTPNTGLGHRQNSKSKTETHLLLCLLGLGNLDLLLALSKELSLLGSLDALWLGKESIVDGFWDGNGSDIDLGGGGDNVGLVNSSEGDTVEPKDETR